MAAFFKPSLESTQLHQTTGVLPLEIDYVWKLEFPRVGAAQGIEIGKQS